MKYNIGFGIPIEFPSRRKKYSNWSINKEIGLLWSRESFEESTISDLESPSNFQIKGKKLFKTVLKQENWTFVVQTVVWGSTILDFESPSNFQVKGKKILKTFQKQRNYASIKNANIVMFEMDYYYNVFY